jgi:hypothetical protein
MKQNLNTSGFWHGGLSIFSDMLTTKEKELLEPLLAELKTTTDSNHREDLEKQIKTIKEDFETKRRNAKFSLYGKA